MIMFEDSPDDYFQLIAHGDVTVWCKLKWEEFIKAVNSTRHLSYSSLLSFPADVY